MKARIGDKTWEVEWCSEIPLDENGDSDMDAAKYHFVHIQDKDKALAYAKKVLPKDAFGAVRVTPMMFVAYDEDDADLYPHVGFWDATSDSIIVDE